MLRRALFVVPFVALAACGSSTTPSSSSSGGDGGATNDGGGGPGSSGGAAASPCAVTRAYVERCAGANELNCGPEKYDAWCAANDQKINSNAYRRAEAKCLPDVSCEPDARRDCEYKAYGSEQPTAAQKSLVEAYCQTCDPSNAAGCVTRAVTYDAAGGPKKVADVFIAAWELADPIVDSIREQCTGAALPPGPDPCEKRFASCAAGPYLDSVPECP